MWFLLERGYLFAIGYLLFAFGYLLGDAVLSKIVLGNIAQSSLGWNATFWALVVGALLAAVICLVSWGKEKRMMEERLAAAQK